MVLKVKILEGKYEAKLDFSRGRGCKKKPSMGGSMDIFWTCTIDLKRKNLFFPVSIELLETLLLKLILFKFVNINFKWLADHYICANLCTYYLHFII